MIEANVMSCKKNDFEDRFNPGKRITGYSLAVSLPDNGGWIEVWSTEERAVGDIVFLQIVEGKNHKARVKVV